MKYDIAKNEEGPLRNTVKLEEAIHQDPAPVQGDEDGLLSTKHPALDGRVKDIESHLAVKYGRLLLFISFKLFTFLCSSSSFAAAFNP